MKEPNSDPFLTRPVTPSSLDLATPSGIDALGSVLPDLLPAPERVGEFVIHSEIGRGGMGIVYRAEDPRLHREVAVKVMLPALAESSQARTRFVREARAQAKIDHDHVAPILHVGEHANRPYIVMPLLRGMTLRDALRLNPRPPLAEVVRIGRETAAGLAAAHEKGLVHRDIKPANIWLEGKRLRVKLLDFGLVCVADAATAPSDHGPLTRRGTVLGTPPYLSPEQGRAERVDGRSDLWSLGVILYEMLTGRRPFRDGPAVVILGSLLSDDPVPPETLVPDLPRRLAALCVRLLNKVPSNRPPTATAVVNELIEAETELGRTPQVPASPELTSPADPFAVSLAERGRAPGADGSGRTDEAPALPRPPAVAPRSWALHAGLLAGAGLVLLVARLLGWLSR